MMMMMMMMKVSTQFEVRIALPVPEINGGTRKNGQSLDTPTLHFIQKLLMAFVRMDAANIPAKFEVRIVHPFLI